MKATRAYKVVLLGGGKSFILNLIIARVGKTSIAERYVKATFTDHVQKTINVSCYKKNVEFDDGRSALLNIWVT